MARKTSKLGRFTVTEILIVLVLLVFIALLVAVTRPNHVGGGPYKSSNCISNLRNIYFAKNQWCLELHKQLTDTPTLKDIQPYLGGGPLPVCPDDSKHTFE